MEHIFEMSKSNTLRYIIFMFPFHMNRKFKSLITHNFLMNLFIKMISKLRYQWKVRVKRMTLVENKMRVFFLKNDICIYHRCFIKKKYWQKDEKWRLSESFEPMLFAVLWISCDFSLYTFHQLLWFSHLRKDNDLS